LVKEPEPTETQLLTSGDFAPGNVEQRIEFAAVSVRFICLESLSSQGGDPFASCAELNLTSSSGKKLDRSKWKVIYTDSEELYAEDGCADNVLDGDPETIWHTEWGAAKPPHPHRLVIDLGETVQFSSLLYLPRQGGTRPGMIRGFKLYVSETGF
jgi:beta-galactosidase